VNFFVIPDDPQRGSIRNLEPDKIEIPGSRYRRERKTFVPQHAPE
jgi:hypothetical protein